MSDVVIPQNGAMSGAIVKDNDCGGFGRGFDNQRGLEGKDTMFIAAGHLAQSLRDISREIGDNKAAIECSRLEPQLNFEKSINFVMGAIKDSHNTTAKEIAELKFHMFEKNKEVTDKLVSMEIDRMRTENARLTARLDACLSPCTAPPVAVR